MGRVRLFVGLAFASLIAAFFLLFAGQLNLSYVLFGVMIVFSVLVVLAAEQARERDMGDALMGTLKLLLRPVNDLPIALRSIVWSFRGAPAISKGEERRLLERLRDVEKGLSARPTPETFYRELDILDAKAAALQQINAIGLAIVVFLQTQQHSLQFRLATFISLVLLAWSVVTVAPLNLVSWGRRRSRKSSEKGDCGGASRAVAEDSTALADRTRLLRLLRLSDVRSNLLRRATVRSVTAFLVVAGLVGAAILGGEHI